MKHIRILIYSALLLLSASAPAQTIMINSIPGSTFCSEDTFFVQYTASGAFTSRNSFTLQLSDANGSFATSFRNLGSVRTTTSGVIEAVVPRNIVQGRRYRMRVIASEPYVVSSDNGQDLALGPRPYINNSTGTRHVVVMVGDTLKDKFEVTGAAVYHWDFGPDAISTSSDSLVCKVVFTTPGRRTVTFNAFSELGCEASQEYPAQIIVDVVSCNPTIPSDAEIDSTRETLNFGKGGNIWVVPGGVANYGSVLYVEPGGTAMSDRGSIVYLKAGAVYDGYDAWIVYEEGAGFIKQQPNYYLFKCPNLEFDYSDAPPYKIKPSSVSRVSGSTIQVYPNPTTDRLTIEHADNIIREISIRNTLGVEQLFVHPEGLGKTSIDVSHLAGGLYFLDLITEKGIETHKVVISR